MKNKNKKWKYVVNNRMSDFAKTDYDTKTISINKKLAKKARRTKYKRMGRYGVTREESTVINSLVHEDLHRKHPKMLEKTVRKEAKRMVRSMNKGQKRRLYGKLS